MDVYYYVIKAEMQQIIYILQISCHTTSYIIKLYLSDVHWGLCLMSKSRNETIKMSSVYQLINA